jgi:hypothetical protein
LPDYFLAFRHIPQKNAANLILKYRPLANILLIVQFFFYINCNKIFRPLSSLTASYFPRPKANFGRFFEPKIRPSGNSGTTEGWVMAERGKATVKRWGGGGGDKSESLPRKESSFLLFPSGQAMLYRTLFLAI